MHGFGGQQHGEFHDQFALGTDSTQIEFAATLDHVVEHRIESELIFAGPL